MRNRQIPPMASFLSGVLLIIVTRFPFLNPESIIIKAGAALGVLLVLIGSGGLIGKLFTKKSA